MILGTGAAGFIGSYFLLDWLTHPMNSSSLSMHHSANARPVSMAKAIANKLAASAIAVIRLMPAG